MEVSQELGGSVITSSGRPLDGFVFQTTIAGISAGQFSAGTAYPGFSKVLVLQNTVAQASMPNGSYVFLQQNIEGYRMSRLAWGTASAQPLTIGFWTAHTRTGVYSGSIRNAAQNRSISFNYTQNVTTTPEYKTVTIPGCTDGVWNIDNLVGINLSFTMACGPDLIAPTANVWASGVSYIAAPGQINAVAATTDVFRITGLVVLPGTDAPSAARSPFIMRPYDQELLICRRYWQRFDNLMASGYAPGAGFFFFGSVPWVPPMRATPTAAVLGATYGNANTAAIQNTTATIISVQATTAAAGNAYAFINVSGDARL